MTTIKLKILVIDDYEESLAALNSALKKAFPSASVLTAPDGVSGIKLAIDEDPDVVLLDVAMPGIDGFEVCRRLKADARLRNIPVVFITVLGPEDDIYTKAMEAGAEAFLHKPLETGEVIVQVSAMAKIKAATVFQLKEKERLEMLVTKRTRELETELAARKQTEMALRERNDELTRFSYAVSHDLKSPLVTIKTFIGYLEEQDIPGQDSAAIAKDFSFINTAADKMFKLLDELLALSRVERNINTHVEIALRALMEEALALVAGRINERGVKVRIIDEMVTLFGIETVTLSGDRQRLLEVFQNLFDNAAKFMGPQPDPVIEAGVDFSGAEPVFFVRDNGIGIDPRHTDKIFGLFEKLDPATEGAGMGLALARRIIEAHGGRIWVESEGPGKGTTFRFTLANTKKIVTKADARMNRR